MKANRFAGFADEDQVAHEVKQQQQQVKQQEQAKKKVVVKVQKDAAPVEDAHEFEKVADKNAPQRGGQRGGRGQGRGQGRGGRGGDRPQTAGEDRRGGDRRRGRGDRPQTAKPVVAEGVEGAAEEKKEQREVRRGRGGRERRADGKAREDAHPMDRQDGTGRGRRGDRKGGHGKGNWGKEDKEPKEDNAAEESKEEKKPRAEKPKEPEPVEEEEVGFTLDDFMAAKQAKSQGLYKKQEMRQVEKGEMKNVKDLDYKHDEMATTKIYKKADTNATKLSAGANLLGFQGQVDAGDEFEARGGKRGGRGGQGPRPDRQQDGNRRRKGGKVVTDDDFPTL